MSPGSENQPIKALLFDVFGTVVDWRGSIIREGPAWESAYGIEPLDWAGFADAWRDLYQPSMSEVRDGRRPWTILDQLHRESLDTILSRFGLERLDEAARAHINRVWHRLDPWPDSAAALGRLKRRYIIATHSNGNIALIVNMARHAGLPWDMVLGAEVTGHYKPVAQSYLIAAERLGLDPGQCMMVAAHNGDLEAARACGLGTAFFPRPAEYGPDQVSDLEASSDWDYVAADLADLADQLGV